MADVNSAVGAVTDTANNSVDTGKAGTAPAGQDTAGTGEKKDVPKMVNMSQEAFDALIEGRLAQQRKQFPADDKLKAFSEWEKSQQTEAEKQAAVVKARDEALAEGAELKLRVALYGAGYTSADDVDYLVYRAGKMDGEQDAKIKKLLTEVPPKKVGSARQDSSPAPKGNASGTSSNDMNSFILSAIGRQ